jgi:hypothetical protein
MRARFAHRVVFSYEKRLMTIEALCPPNPNEFETATSKLGRSRATFGT